MEMERDFNIQCSSESEYSPQNKRWCLRQIEKDGTSVGRDLVPCSYFHYFQASEVIHTISHEERFAETTPEKLETEELIYATLVPDRLSSRTSLNSPHYYIVGYRDTIENISLEISRGENDGHCIVSSYEKTHGDIDMDDRPHSLHFCVNLSAKKFDGISQLLKLDRLDRLSLAVRFADGFYSEYFHHHDDGVDSIYVLSSSALEDLNLEDYADHLSVTGKVGSFIIYAGQQSGNRPKQGK